jgi:23S rRNA (uracil1939-C5)-methyltransferase
LQIVIQGIGGLTLETHPELPQVANALAALDGVSTVAYRHRSGQPRALAGDLFSQIEVAGRMMWLPSGSFFQTNLEMLPDVIERMRRPLREREVHRIADIYGGVGTFGLALAAEVESVTLVELDPLAVSAAERTAADWGLDNVRFIRRHAERALPMLSGLDVAILDPPRSGLGDVITRAIAASGPPLVWYVSCSPVSLARDLAALQEAGYRVSCLEIFDFYPQTYHVESLAMLERPC